MGTYDGVVFDVDGTLLRGTTPIPGAAETVQTVRETGAAVGFVTNNPTRTPDSYVEKLDASGIDAEPREVVTSGSSTAAYLDDRHAGSAVFVVGEDSLRAQIDGGDVDVVSEPSAADGVVASIDRSFSYETLTDALIAFEDGEPWFVGTDPDRTIPTEDGLVPGSGGIVESVAAVVERRPDAVLGKPHPFTIDLVFDRLDCDPTRTLVVGDRLNTDIAFGDAAGATTVLVETGVTTGEAAEASDVQPDHVLTDVTQIVDFI